MTASRLKHPWPFSASVAVFRKDTLFCKNCDLSDCQSLMALQSWVRLQFSGCCPGVKTKKEKVGPHYCCRQQRQENKHGYVHHVRSRENTVRVLSGKVMFLNIRVCTDKANLTYSRPIPPKKKYALLHLNRIISGISIYKSCIDCFVVKSPFHTSLVFRSGFGMNFGTTGKKKKQKFTNA